MNKVMQIVEEIHNLNPKISKSKILLYLYIHCNPLKKSCKNCPLKGVEFCDIMVEQLLIQRELKNANEITEVIANYKHSKGE